MRIVLQSEVSQAFETVAEDFGRYLFDFLLPPKRLAILVKYEGSAPGSRVHIRFRFPFPGDWISRIASEYRTDEKYVFVDEGEKLPFGLKQWTHIHTIIKTGENTTTIIDDMNFSTGDRFFDFLVYPVLYLSFYPRKRLYKKYYEKWT